jgi:Arc/MetJ-type ribon-helix-helix transcriptional regulator
VETQSLSEKKKQQSKTALTLREEMLESLSISESEAKREIPVMTRLGTDLVELLDILVKLDIFNSRSEAVAAIVEKTLFSQQDKFDLLKAQVDKLEKIQATAKGIGFDILKGEE